MPTVTYIGHATVLIEMDGVRLLTDPMLRDHAGLLRRQGPAPDPESWQDLDAVLISHTHFDHLHLPSLRLLDRTAPLIVPRGVAERLRSEGFERIEELRPGQKATAPSVEVVGTPARHSVSRVFPGPAGECLGFIIRGSSCIYFPGDTGLFPEMADLADDIDLALLPVWGWGPRLRGLHLNPRAAAEALTLLRPQVSMPIHWGTFAPLGIAWMRPQFLTRPPHEFAQYAAELAPGVEVRIPAPGELIAL
jgi:L-ascorbate metabolism protein UlaG (beta-lactamase superfamily)